MTLFVLCVLALLDGLLCGARVWMGRSALIAKREYYLRAQFRGFVGAQIVSTVTSAALILIMSLSAHRIALRADLERAAGSLMRRSSWATFCFALFLPPTFEARPVS